MDRAHKILPRTDPRSKIPFMFIYKSTPHPFWCGGRRSCSSGCSTAASRAPGGLGIGFDFEYSVRNTVHGYSVGLYNSGVIGGAQTGRG